MILINFCFGGGWPLSICMDIGLVQYRRFAELLITKNEIQILLFVFTAMVSVSS